MNQATLRHLNKDPVLKILLKSSKLKDFDISKRELLEDLIRSIVNQQLSSKAAATIYGRFLKLLPNGAVVPREILKLSDDELRSAGLSRPKIKYITGICEGVSNNDLDLSLLTNKPDEEVIVELVRLKGVGRWTAEMILIFSLGRTDIFSLGDIGLRNAVAKLYHIDRDNLVEVERISLNWSPYRTYASRLLWESLNNQ